MYPDLDLLLIATVAVLVAGISKAGFGGGLVILAVPIVSLVTSPQEAAAILLPVLLFMDAVNIKVLNGKWDKSIVATIIPAALVGIMIGTLTFNWLDATSLQLLIGFLAVYFTVYHYLKPKLNTRKQKENRISGYFWGAVAAFTSFTAHAGGPPLNMYLLPLKLPKATYVATLSTFIAFTNITKVFSYSYMGLFTKQGLLLSLLLIPAAAIGAKLGFWLQKRLNEQWFYHICYGLLFFAGLKLIFSAML